MLLVDNREDPKIVRIVERLELEHEVKQLEIGDFVFPEKNICIERKSILDYIGSIKSGHLQTQLANMSANYDRSFLIISGYLRDIGMVPHVQWSVEQHLGSLASLTRDFPTVSILQVDNDTQLVKLVEKLGKKIGDGKIKNHGVGRIYGAASSVNENVLCCFEGIGPKTATKILEKHNLRHVLLNPELCEELNEKQKSSIQAALKP